MDSQKFNINSLARDKIRQSFLNRHFLQQRTVDESKCPMDTDSSGTRSYSSGEEPSERKLNEENKHITNITVAHQFDDGLLLAEKDDGFPLITSVFSLANQETHSSHSLETSDIPSAVANTRVEAQSMSERNNVNHVVHKANINKLPFVVQCNDGVIIVRTPVESSSSAAVANYDACFSHEPQQDIQTHDLSTPVSSELSDTSNETNIAMSSSNTEKSIQLPVDEFVQCVISNSESPASHHSPKVRRTQLVDSIPNTNFISNLQGTKRAAKERPILPKPPAPDSIVRNTAKVVSPPLIDDSEKTSENNSGTCPTTTPSISLAETSTDEIDLKAKEVRMATSSDEVMSDNEDELTLITQQDNKIRRLKDLLHKQEQELEKVRFKEMKSGSHFPRTSSSNDDSLRIKLLMKETRGSPPQVSCDVVPDSEDVVPSPSVSGGSAQNEIGLTTKKQQSAATVVSRNASHTLYPNTSTPSNKPLNKGNDSKVQVLETSPAVGGEFEGFASASTTSTTASLQNKLNKTKEQTDKKNQLGSTCRSPFFVPSILKKRKPQEVFSSKDKQITIPPAKKKCTPTKLTQTKVSTNLDSYHLVKVDVMNGHTRTLFAPVHHRKGSTPLSKNPTNLSCGSSAQKDNKGQQAATISAQNQMYTVILSSNSDNVTAVREAESLSKPKSDTCVPSKKGSDSVGLVGDMTLENSLLLNTTEENHVLSSKGIESPELPEHKGNANEVDVTCSTQQSAHDNTVKQYLGKSPDSQPIENTPTRGSKVKANHIVDKPASGVTQTNNLISEASTNRFPNVANHLTDVNTGMLTTKTSFLGAGNTQANSSYAENRTVNARPVSLSTATVRNIENEILAVTSTSEIPNQAEPIISPNDQAITANATPRPCNIAPKPPSMVTLQNSGVTQKNEILFYSSPTPASIAGAPRSNLADGKIVICSVVPPETSLKTGEVAPSNVNKQGKIVFHVSKQGVATTLGIVHDNKVMMNSGDSCLSLNNLDETKALTGKDGAFIPNPNDMDFTNLVGLESIVCSLEKDS